MQSFDRFVASRMAYIVLALLVFFAALPGMSAMPVLDRDEGRFTQASSQMLESGDYVVIRYHEGLRNKKPVGIHWMQAASVALTEGPEAREIWSYRMPSLLGAMLAAVAAFWAGGAMMSRRAAFMGAALLGVCLILSSEAHIAKTDAAQVGFLALMLGSLAHIRRDTIRFAGVYGEAAENPSRNRILSLVFWISLGVGVLLKGVIAPMVAGLAIVGLLLWERRFSWLRPLSYWLGISIFCVMTIPWFVAVQVATGGEFLFEAAAVDLGQKIVSAAEGHEGPPGLHIAALPILFWPGTLLLLPAIGVAVSSLRKRKEPAAPARAGDPTLAAAAAAASTRSELIHTDAEIAAGWRLLICWIIPSWIVFEVAPTKLVHYTLPMYPAIALACGAAFDRWCRDPNLMRTPVAWVSLVLFVAVSIVLAGIASPAALAAFRADAAADFGPELQQRVAWIWSNDWAASGMGLWPTLLILAATAGVAYAFWRKSALLVFTLLIVTGFIGGVAYRGVVLPNQTWMLATPASLNALEEICAFPADTARWKNSGCAETSPEGLRAPNIVRAIAYAEPSLVFSLGGKIALPGDKASSSALPEATEDARPAWLINTGEAAGREALAAIIEQAAAADRCVRLARRYALNYSNGDPSVLVAAVVEPAGTPCPGGPALRPTTNDTPPPEPVLEQ